MNYDLARLAYERISAEGPTVESDRGNTSEHPAIQTLNSATIRPTPRHRPRRPAER